MNAAEITLLMWHGKRYVTLLTTCNSIETVPVTWHSETVIKLQAVIDHSTGKSSIYLLDQMSSYSTSLQRSVIWHKTVMGILNHKNVEDKTSGRTI
jgi:hypothetical protein